MGASQAGQEVIVGAAASVGGAMAVVVSVVGEVVIVVVAASVEGAMEVPGLVAVEVMKPGISLGLCSGPQSHAHTLLKRCHQLGFAKKTSDIWW